MHYINAVPSRFENMADFISMWHAVIFNEGFQDLTDIALDKRTWAPASASENIIRKEDDG